MPKVERESAAPPKPRHTPSPWESVCDADGDHAIWANDVLIAVTDGWPDATARVHSEKVRTHDEDEANAHLIAAAPEMLELLEEAVLDAEKCVNPGMRLTNYDKVKAIIRRTREVGNAG